MLKILLLKALIVVLSVSLACGLTTIKTKTTAYLSFTAYNGTQAMHICGNNGAYLPVVNSEAKRLWYRALKEKIAEIVPVMATLPYAFWTNATSEYSTAFFFDDYPNCSELPATSSLWADRSFTYSGQGVMFKESTTTSTITDADGRSHMSMTTTFGLVPTDLATMSNVVMCEREVGPCSFSQKTPGQCPFLSDTRLTYVFPSVVTISGTCEQTCREAFVSGEECWGFLYSPSQNECGLVYTENPALLALQQETVSCGADVPADVEYYVKECYIIAVNADTQSSTGSFLTRMCTLPGMVAPTTLSSSQSSSLFTSSSVSPSQLTVSPRSPNVSSTASSNISSPAPASASTTPPTSPSMSSQTSANISSQTSTFIAPPTSPSTLSAVSPTVSSSQSPTTATSTPYSPLIAPLTLVPVTPVYYLRACFCFKQTSNLTQNEILAGILTNLTIDVSKTSATIRSKTTAVDNRSSAIAIGVIGVIAVLVPGVLIVFSDFLTLFCKAPSKIAKQKT